MNLRNILLVMSLIFFGLSISLYYQTGQEAQTVNWEQYRNVAFNEDSSYSIEDLNKKLDPLRIEDMIQEIREKNLLHGEKTRIMEIGARSGQILMALEKKFPDIEFYGVNRQKTHHFYRREGFIQTALHFEIMTEAELKNIDLPYIVFQNLDWGRKIPYDDNKFDLIYSVNIIRLFKYKFELFNEIMRVLKPGGRSFHTDLTNINMYSDGMAIDMKEAFHEMKKQGIDITFMEEGNILSFKKGPDYRPFPTTPHQPVPEKIDNLSQDFLSQEMGYNLNLGRDHGNKQ